MILVFMLVEVFGFLSFPLQDLTYNSRVMSTPIRHDKSLEAELAFEEVVEGVAVGATIRVVNLVVTAHYRSRASTNSVGEGP